MNITIRPILEIIINGEHAKLDEYFDFLKALLGKGISTRTIRSGPKPVSVGKVDPSKFLAVSLVGAGKKKRFRSLLALQKFIEKRQ